MKSINKKMMAVLLSVTALTLGAGYLLKAQCNSIHHQKQRWDLTRDCYSDISMVIYSWRKQPFALKYYYRPFSKHGVAYRDNNLEYPALTGLFVTAVNAPIPNFSPGGFLAANAIGLAIFALLGAAAMVVISTRPRRLLFLALAPELIAYGFHNWDLMPLGFTALGLYAFVRRKDGLAGLMLGLGAAAKLYPLFFIPVLAVARIVEHSPGLRMALRDARARARSYRLLLWGAIGLAAPNLIVLAYAGRTKMLFPWRWQSQRLPNSETHWLLLFQYLHFGTKKGPGPHFSEFVQFGSLAIFVVIAGLYIWREAKRDHYRPITTCFAVILIYLLTAKVLSPQYMIWLLPFFVLVSMPWWTYAFFALADMFELGAIWSQNLHNGTHTSAPYLVMVSGVALRYAMMLTLLWYADRKGTDLVDYAQPEARSATRPAPVAPARA